MMETDRLKKLVQDSLDRISYLSEKALEVKDSTIKQMEKELEDLRIQKEMIEKALKNYEEAKKEDKAEALERLEAEMDWSVVDNVRYRFYQWSDKLSDFPEWADKTFSAIVDDAARKSEEIEKEIIELEKKAENTSGEIKEKMEKEIAYLKEKKKEMEQRMHDFSDKSSKAWNAFSSGIKEAGSALNKAFQDAYKSFNQ